jgi:hypothetical protein
MPRVRVTRRWLIVAVAILAVLVGTQACLEVDLSSGRTRSGLYLYGLPCLRVSRETGLSRALPAVPSTRNPPEWRRVNSFTIFSPGVSPHYSFHLAAHQIEILDRCWERAAFTPAARRVSAQTVLRLWHEHDRYYEAEIYLDAVRAVARRSEGKAVDITDLPPPHPSVLDPAG